MWHGGGTSDGHYPTAREAARQRGKAQGREVTRYAYRDEQGRLLFWVVRFDPKAFRYCRPSGNGGEIWNLEGVRRVPYRLNEILDKDIVYVVEGEKDADRLWSLGIPATTSPMGAKNWRAEYAQFLKGKQVVILPDNDADGERYARDVARSLQGVATAVKVVRLPGLSEKGDVSDWLATGGTKEAMLELVERTPWCPDDRQPLPAAAQPGERKADDSPWSGAVPAPKFLAQEDVPFEGFARDLLAPGALTLIAAPKGIGKTQIVHALAVALATGGVFRGEKLPPKRVLLVDRDNPATVVRQRLRSWGASAADALSILTRQKAPPLTDKAAWGTFPVDQYDVVLVDSVGASTEGVTEKEGRQTTEIVATLKDLATRGPAVLLLANTTKDALSYKGRDEWAAGVDILYEVRDATGLTPSGKLPWFQELPEGGATAFANRAARRQGRVDYRLAFIPAKFRLGPDPEPFCLEIHLPKDEPWTLRDVTAEILKAGEAARAKEEAAKDERLEKAAQALAEEVRERALAGSPMRSNKDAESWLMRNGLTQAESRKVLKMYEGKLWTTEVKANQPGRPKVLLPILSPSATEIPNPSNPHKTYSQKAPISVGCMDQGQRKYPPLQPANGAGERGITFPLPEEKERDFGPDEEEGKIL